VREVDPPRPSSRLSTVDTLPNIAANRSIEPAKLSKLLQRELDWVVMKALDKDRTRRYETANELSRDLERYLADEMVEARPPSTGYRLKKFVRRHKGQVIAAGLVLFALLAGMVGTTLGLIEAKKQAEIAVAQKKLAEENGDAAKKQRDRADEEAMIAKSLTRFLLEKLLGESRAASEELTKVLSEIVDATTAKSKRVEFVASFRRYVRANNTVRSMADNQRSLPTRPLEAEDKALFDALMNAAVETAQQMEKLGPLAQKYPAEMHGVLSEALQDIVKKK
jgi:eukaryotic-like serine/threonine-protein kinase